MASIPCIVCCMVSLSSAANFTSNGTCSKCQLNLELAQKIAELETRIRTLYQIQESETFLDSLLPEPDASLDASVSPPPVSSLQDDFITVPKKHSCRPRAAEHHPTRVFNRYSPLSNTPTEKALIIGDSILRNVRLETPGTIVQCIPGARATDIEANLKVLAKSKRKYSRIVIHAGTNDIRLRQSEVTKNNFISVCAVAKKMCREVICSGPLPARRSDEVYSRLSSLNLWLSEWCSSSDIGFINNWPDFWGRPGLLKRDGLHPSWRGSRVLSNNIAASLNKARS